MKCPYCGYKGAKVQPNMVCPERSIHSALDCRNPECTAFDPGTFGVHPKMPAETKAVFRKILHVLRSESDFELVARRHSNT